MAQKKHKIVLAALVAALCVGGLLIPVLPAADDGAEPDGASPPVASEATAAKQAAPDKIVSETPTATQAAFEVEVADETGAADDFTATVPDGSAEELLAFIEQVRTADSPEITTQAEYEAYLSSRLGAIHAAAEKILQADADDEQLVQAARFKLESLSLLAKYQIGDAEQQLRKAKADMRKDDRAPVAAEIRFQDLQAELQSLPALSEEDQRAIVAKTADFLSASSPGHHAELALMLVMTIEQMQNTELLTEASRVLREPLIGNDDADVERVAKQLAGIHRRLTLVGKPVEIWGDLVDGKPFDWDAYKGKVVLIDFWATWCPPCRAAMPELRRLLAEYQDRGFEIVGVSMDEERADLEQYLADERLPWAILSNINLEDQEKHLPVASHYGVSMLPTMFLVGRDGMVISVSVHEPELAALLTELIGPADSSSETDAGG